METRIPQPVVLKGLYYNGTREELKSAMSYVGTKEGECEVYPLTEKDHEGNLKPEGQRYGFAFYHRETRFHVNPGDILVWGIFGEFYVITQDSNYKSKKDMWKTDWSKREKRIKE